LGVVRHRVPDRPAAALHPPLPVPGLGGSGEGLRLERLRGIAGHRVEAPRERSALRVVGREVAAHAELGAAVADQHLALHHARGAGDGVGPVRIHGQRLPELPAGGGVERHQPAVERAEEELALVDRYAAVHHVAAGEPAVAPRHLRVERPKYVAGARVDGVYDAPRAGREQHAVDGERGRFDAALGAEVDAPLEAELLDVAVVDLVERAHALLVVGAAVGQPVADVAARRAQARVVDRPGAARDAIAHRTLLLCRGRRWRLRLLRARRAGG